MTLTDAGKTDRKVYFDYLRVFATIAVIFVHTAAQNWNDSDINGFEWNVFNVYDSIARWCVPVFVMISGALFLNRDMPVKKIYKKYVLRMFTAFFFWSFIYSLFDDFDINTRISTIITGHYHMWFLLMIAGLYMCIPFIKGIISKTERMLYFLVLSFIFTFLIPQIIYIINDFAPEGAVSIANAFSNDVIRMNMHMVLGFAGYFVLGYFLDKVRLEKKERYILYGVGAAGAFITIFLSYAASSKLQEPVKLYYDSLRVNVLMESTAVFVFFKYVRLSKRLYPFILKISRYCFGAYLVHVLLLELMKKYLSFGTLSFNPLISVPVITIIITAASFAISAGLNHIPVVKKLIV